MSWVSHRDLAAAARVRLFCLPHAGSGAAAFFRWKKLLPSGIAVCPVMLPGREARLSDEPLRSIAAMVNAMHEELRPQLNEPYAIFGHSMSALIAFEWAHRIQLDGLPLPQKLFVSGRHSPQSDHGPAGIHRLGDEEMCRELDRRYGGNLGVLLFEPDLRQVFLPILRADLEAVECYKFISRSPLRCPLRAYAGAEDLSVTDNGLAQWSATTSSSFATRRFCGDHFYHQGAGQQDVLDEIARELEL